MDWTDFTGSHPHPATGAQRDITPLAAANDNLTLAVSPTRKPGSDMTDASDQRDTDGGAALD